jgi:hypothetical protein
MPAINKINRRDLLVLLLILFVAAVMRFGQAGLVEFFHDDAMLSSLAQEMAAGQNFPLRGINSSTGIPNPPTSVYVMAIPFFINSNPMTAIYFVMGINVIGVGLLWLIAHRYLGRNVALAAGLAYALSPWAVLFSRKIWAQEFHSPFILLAVLLGLYGFWEASSENRSQWLKSQEWAQVFCLPVLLFAFQIHFAAWALVPIYAAIVLLAWKRISWRAIAISAILCALVLLPYAIGFYQTWQRNPSQGDPNAVSTLANKDEAFSLLSMQYLGYLATGFGMETWVAPKNQAEMLAAVPPVQLWYIIGGMVLLGTIRLFLKSWRRFAPLLLLWAYLPAIALIPQWTGVYPHYFIASIPALMLLAGLGVDWIAKHVPLKSLGQSIVLASFALILLTQGIYFRALMRYVDSVELDYPAFTTPIHYLEDVEAALADYQDVIVLSDGMSWDLHHESVVWPVMLRDTAQCVRTLVGDGYAVFPNHPFAALQAPNMPEHALSGLYLSENQLYFPERDGGSGYYIHHWQTNPEWQGVAITEIEPIRFAGDVLLTGYGLDEGVTLLQWQLPAANPELEYQWSVQPHNANGEKLGQSDTRFWQGRHWCEGDRLLTWQWFDTPHETASLHVYLYELGGANEAAYLNAPVLDAMGNPANDHAVIEIVR